MIRAALYLRVSAVDQHIENQRPALMRMAEARGMSVAAEHVFADEGISGTRSKWERPGLRALLEAAARGEVRGVLVWAYDRLSREADSFYGGLLTVADLERHGCDVLSHEETWLEFAGPMKEPMRLLVFKLAAEERRKNRGRQEAGRSRIREVLASQGTFVARKSGKVRTSLGKPGKTVTYETATAAKVLREKGLSWEDVRLGVIAAGFPDHHKANLRRAVLRWNENRDPKTAKNQGQGKGAVQPCQG